jgi:XTP/dITP diphosphohydrolase
LAAELLVATRSADKLQEIRAILAHANARLLTLRDLGVEPTPAEDEIEVHATFVGNAAAKARYFAHLTGMRTLADDSGLVVAALDGGPGVRTRRFAIDHNRATPETSGQLLDDANNQLLLEKLDVVADDQRGAHYVCASALATPQHLLATSIGTVRGRIARTLRGTSGFGYDPLFFIEELGITFGELSRAQKNDFSHRARAFRAIAAQLK